MYVVLQVGEPFSSFASHSFGIPWHSQAHALTFNSSYLWRKKETSAFLLQGIQPHVLDRVGAIQNLSFGMPQMYLYTCINQSMQKGITHRLCNTVQLQRTVWLPCTLLPPPCGLLHVSFLCTLNSDRATESCRCHRDQAAFLQRQLSSLLCRFPCSRLPCSKYIFWLWKTCFQI